MQESIKQGPAASPNDSTRKQEHVVDPEATSAETIADIEEKDETINSGESTRSPSPDGTITPRTVKYPDISPAHCQESRWRPLFAYRIQWARPHR